MDALSERWDQFQMKHSYKGLVKGTSRGSIWVGPVTEPLKIMDNNYWVVSTDYETYAITY
jgi:hypothetical protein